MNVNEKNEKKKNYVSPSLIVEYIELEEGFAANSSTIVPPTITDGITVEDWNNVKGNDDTFIEI
ncbi:hypothetical protein [Elizabethkingia ursingii]|uniref:Uncharacterized protein n=1 Tax=Elizabethkingia ursingii TaxID=1756150 RepID=A0ABX3N7X4_9FLAO|nr:hypothetical protein [Elizabethkingia ursingii]OPB88675.1 hypothetical protein BB021_04650 [Elizabethkingia ursingii]